VTAAVPAHPVPALSIVSTLYRSAPFLPTFVAECRAALAQAAVASWEIVLVNDGSPDESLALAQQFHREDARVVVVDLSRNFGHHAAMHAGLSHARGLEVFLIDCDLEVRPAVLGILIERRRATGADLVFGYQEARKGGWFERASGAWFWRGLNAVSDVPIPQNMLTERLMSRRFVDALLALGDRQLFLGGMMSWTGFVQIGVVLPKQQREGRSTYTLARRVALMLTALSSFSSRPLVWLFQAGVAITVASLALGCWLLLRWWLHDTPPGWTSLMAMLALNLGVSTTALGLVGIYLGRVYDQVRERPRWIVRDLLR
jgi:putative glycosyltransferase